MKTHLNLATRDLARSVAFYGTLLDAKPLKHLDDYALFVTENPGLELALDADENARPDRSMHFGVAVETEEAVAAATKRLRSAGFAADVESDEVCCYARQTKVWSADPDGRRWETYVVHEETEQRDDADRACCTA
jgi:catechol 2,3-dioxygenase-like lactoylglutathione lyase family enzyme